MRGPGFNPQQGPDIDVHIFIFFVLVLATLNRNEDFFKLIKDKNLSKRGICDQNKVEVS